MKAILLPLLLIAVLPASLLTWHGCEAAGELGADATQVGVRGSEGAIQAAGDVSNMAVRTVRDVLVGIAAGLGQTIQAALPQGAAAPPHAAQGGPAGGTKAHH